MFFFNREYPTDYQQQFLDMTFDQFISQTNINDILNEGYLLRFPEADTIDRTNLQTCQKYAFEKLGRVRKWDRCFLKNLKLGPVEPLGAETSPIVDFREKSPAPQQGDEGAETVGEEAGSVVNMGEKAKCEDSMEQGDGDEGTGNVEDEVEGTDNVCEKDGGSKHAEENRENTIKTNRKSAELHERLSELTSGIIMTLKDIAEEVDRFASCETQIGAEVSQGFAYSSPLFNTMVSGTHGSAVRI